MYAATPSTALAAAAAQPALAAGTILDQHGRPILSTADRHHHLPRAQQQQRRGMVRARFDSEVTSDENRRHWAMATAASVDATANPLVRRTIRMRTRYEYHNNSWFMGMADTVGNYVVGTGPRLQMQTKRKSLNQAIEREFARWAKAVGWAQTLKSMRMARIYNGEAVAVMRTNPNLPHEVKLDLFEVEADQLASPTFGSFDAVRYPDQFFDGVELDPYGRPKSYQILRQHPGALSAFFLYGTDYDTYDARWVLHDYKRIRPGQQRGIPEALPALKLFAELRRYTLAVLGAAETAADYAAVIQSEAAADGEAAEVAPMDTVELERRMATVLPAGWSLNQVKAEQPTTTYEMFLNALLAEIARCCNMPLFFISLDARQANMSSAYVVTQPFARSVSTDRAGYEILLDRVFDEWLTEALRIPGLLPSTIDVSHFAHSWRWPRIGQHADPQKTSAAAETRLRAGISSLPLEIAEDGNDWEEVQESAAKSLGMTIDDYRAALRARFLATPGQTGQPGGQPAAGPAAPPAADPEEADEDDAQERRLEEYDDAEEA